jgi:nucleoside phosphorylase
MVRRPFFLIVDVESILGEEEVWSRQARVTVRKGNNFWFDRWIAIKILQEFPEAILHGMDVESTLGEAEVLLRQARVTVRTVHNIWSDRWIAIKILQEFPEALLHGLDVESILV